MIDLNFSTALIEARAGTKVRLTLANQSAPQHGFSIADMPAEEVIVIAEDTHKMDAPINLAVHFAARGGTTGVIEFTGPG